MSSAQKAMLMLPVESVHCPFLYRTRTILQHQIRHYRVRHGAVAAPSPQYEIPFTEAANGTSRKLDSSDTSSFLKQKAAQVNAAIPKPGSSITPAEQAAFDNIMTLFRKPAPSTAKARATSTDHTDTDYKNILDLFSPPATASDGDVLDTYDAEKLYFEEQPQRSKRPRRKPLSSPSLKLDRESAMAEIQDFLQDSASSSGQVTRSPNSQSADAVRAAAYRIVEDVADSLTIALDSHNPRPDIAMWQVAEEKIFPLIRLLRPSASALSPSKLIQPADDGDGRISRSPTQPNETQQQQAFTHPLVSGDVPVLPLLSLTYPSLTLLILRLYANHHPTSPYALALLPTLKSLGPTSYVLGAHTHFYNALLSLYWRVYSDLRGMHDLLAEMDTNGVEFDVGTWEALGAVEEDRRSDDDDDHHHQDNSSSDDGADHHTRGKRWWTRTEQAVWSRRVGVEWRDMIGRKLQDQGLMLTREVMREEADGLTLPSGMGVDHDGLVRRKERGEETGDRPEYVVTL